MTFIPSPQQADFFNWISTGKGSAFLQARAGTGKTTTLIEGCKLFKGTVILLAFNKNIVEEIKGRLTWLNKRDVEAATFHSVGLKAVRKVYPRTRIDAGRKRDEICQHVGIPQQLQSFVFALVSHAKNRALDEASIHDDAPFWDIIEHFDLLENIEKPEDAERGIEFAQQALAYSIEIAPQFIDFDDMIWLPVIKGLRMWQYDNVLIDEAQDTNEVRRMLARKLLRPGARSVWVGDDRQSIYGFTGADADSVKRIIREFNCTVLPLTVTYRCPKAVVEFAKAIVPDYQAHESAPEGVLRRIKQEELFAQSLLDTDAILCRKTKPLVELAFTLIRKNIACHVEGRDIGAGLMKLATRWKIKNVPALVNKLNEYKEREVQKLIAKGRETQAEALADRVETLVALAEGCDTVECIVDKITRLFQDTEGNSRTTLTLATVHRSKGREWPRVFILGYHQFQPSRWARQEWEMEQERNLQYVAITRAKAELVTVDVPADKAGCQQRAY